MRLLYIWVEDYKCFKNQGFNLSSKFRFEYDKDNNILKVRENENYIEEFFNDSDKQRCSITEVTAIVGKNGSGKSTLLDLLTNFSNKNFDLKKDYLIAILNNKNEINIISKIDNFKINANSDDLDKCIYIYHSNALEYQYYKDNSYKNICDISTVGLMRDDNRRLYDMHITNLNNNEIVSFFNEELRRQVEFVYEFNDSDKYIDFKMPTSLSGSFRDIRDIRNFKKSIYLRIDGEYGKENIKNSVDKDENINRTLLRNLLKIDDKFNQIHINTKCNSINLNISLIEFKKRLLQGIYLNALDCIIPSTVPTYKDEKYEIINQILEYEIISNIHNIHTIEEFWDSIEKFLEGLKTYSFLDFFENEFYDSLKKFRENIKDVFIEKIQYKPWLLNWFVLETNKNIENNVLYKARNFYNLYKKTVFNFNYIQFEWNMSDGENNLLNLFARFYSLRDRIPFNHNKNSIEELIIFMDEVDMSFHPEWQRRYIKLMIDFFNLIFLQYKVHLIITTHSPIILSDIPSDNIIYLSKGVNISNKMDVNKKTFASNIYNLYKEDFFFDVNNKDDSNKYLLIIGKFAWEKINYVIEILDNYINSDKDFNKNNEEEFYKSLDNCRKFINFIGEPIIRNMLENKYKAVMKKMSKYKKINKHKELNEYIENFKSLSKEDKEKFIRYIINEYEQEGQ